MKLKTKFSIYVTGLVFLVVMSLGLMVIFTEKRTLERETERHHVDLAKRLARICEESLYQSDVVLFNYFRSLEPEVGFVAAAFADPTGLVKLHSDLKMIGQRLPLPPADIPAVHQVQKFRDPQGLDVYSAEVRFGQEEAGTARLFMDPRFIDRHISESLSHLTTRMLFIGSLVLVLGLIGAVVLAKTLVSPIEHIVQGMQKVAKGLLDPLPSLKRSDELGWLVSEINTTIHKLRELDEMKREFVSSVTHEFRSPLTAIERFVSLLLKGVYGRTTSEQQDTLMIVKNNTIRLNSFVDDLLTTAKLEAKRVDLFFETVDLTAVIKDVAALFSSFSESGLVQLVLDCSPQSMNIQTDRTKLTHVLSNLVSNGFKFTSQGTVTIQVGRAPDGIEILVKDTGMGIPDHEKGKVFDKFFRGSSTHQTTKGTGLGLSIVKSYVELLKGRIDVMDNPGGGTIFKVVLPE